MSFSSAATPGPTSSRPPDHPRPSCCCWPREGLLGDLRDTLDRARRDNIPARKEGVRVKTNDHFQDIDLEVIPISRPALGACATSWSCSSRSGPAARGGNRTDRPRPRVPLRRAAEELARKTGKSAA